MNVLVVLSTLQLEGKGREKSIQAGNVAYPTLSHHIHGTLSGLRIHCLHVLHVCVTHDPTIPLEPIPEIVRLDDESLLNFVAKGAPQGW